MVKVSVNLGRVCNTMVVKLAMIVKDDIPKGPNEIINKYNANGNEYISFNLHPYMVIDIKKMGDPYDSNNSVTLTAPFVGVLCRAIKRELELLKTPDLFFYDGEKHLKVNKEVAKDCICKVMVKQKYIGITPMVVCDNEDEYEGFAFFINSVDHVAQLTIFEMQYLLDILEKTDMTAIGLELLNAYRKYGNSVESKHIGNIVQASPVQELEDRRVKDSPLDKLPDLK